MSPDTPSGTRSPVSQMPLTSWQPASGSWEKVPLSVDREGLSPASESTEVRRPHGRPRHPGNQDASRVGEGLPGIAVAVGGIAHGLLHRHTGVGLTLLLQFQRPQIVRSNAGQYVHCGDQLGAGVHHNRRLVTVEASTAALVPMAHLRVMHRHRPVPAHPVPEAHSVISALHVLEQQSAQQFRRRHNPLALLTVLRQLSLSLPRQFQLPILLLRQAMRIGHQGHPGYWAVYA